MLPVASIAVATILLVAAATDASKGTSAEIEVRSEISVSPDGVVHHEDTKREKRETPREDDGEAPGPRRRESSADELAAAVAFQNVGYRDTGNHANEHPRRAVDDAWRDAVPGTPGVDYPKLDGIPVTSFSCADKEPGGYYADVETGCQVFHVCNTGGAKSSFLCPPGNIFDQRYFVCDWWYGVNCQEAVDLHFARPEENFADPSDYDDDYNNGAVSGNFENSSTEVTGSFDYTTPGGHSQDPGIRNYARPSNDLSPSSGERRDTAGGYLSGPASRRMDRGNNVRDYSSDSGTLGTRDDGAATPDDNAPRGFSSNDNKSSKRRKLDRTTNQRELTNDLASYVNHAYFQAGLRSNGNDDDDDDDDNDDEDGDRHNVRDNYGEMTEYYSSKTSFGDKLTYEKSSRSGYHERDDISRAPNFKSIVGYE